MHDIWIMYPTKVSLWGVFVWVTHDPFSYSNVLQYRVCSRRGIIIPQYSCFKLETKRIIFQTSSLLKLIPIRIWKYPDKHQVDCSWEADRSDIYYSIFWISKFWVSKRTNSSCCFRIRTDSLTSVVALIFVLPEFQSASNKVAGFGGSIYRNHLI